MNKEKEKQYEKYIAIQPNNEIPNEELIKIVGKLVDISCDLKKIEGLQHSINLSNRLLESEIKSSQKALIYYFMANAYEDMRRLSINSNDDSWKWEQTEIKEQLFFLRSSIRENGFAELNNYRKCQIYTNLGNVLNFIGRFIEAIEYFDSALETRSQFAMAIGNKGIALFEYGKRLYDDGHSAYFYKYAYDCFKKAIELPLETKEAYNRFKSYKENVPKEVLLKNIDWTKYDIGETNEERAYRKWCLENRLFLNPLNDLDTFPIAATDVLLLPSIIVPFGHGPYYQGLYNQMKQEYVSARFLYYDGTNNRGFHFSDKDVFLYNTLDYPCYCFNIEKVKASFRILYSLFDKIGFFLNHYLKLGIPEKKVSFRKLWYDTKTSKDIRDEFKIKPNWPLRGLFWLSKDLYIPNFQESLEPEAQEVCDIRNHLEHKYLKVHDNVWLGPVSNNVNFSKAIEDSLAYSIRRKEFEKKTLKLMKLARAALIYLSLGVHMEEKQRKKNGDSNKFIQSIELTLQEDKMKI